MMKSNSGRGLPSPRAEPSVTPAWHDRPRRLSELWKLDRATGEVVTIVGEGLANFNAMGTAVWLRLDGEHSLRDIAEELVATYGEPERQRIEDDLRCFIEDLVARQLVVVGFVPL